MDCGRDAMVFLTEKFIDFESLRVNGYDIQSLFFDQQWQNYFDMLNGFVYYDIVKNFWHKAYVFDKIDAEEEVKKMVKENKALKGKTREQLGLRPFRGKEVRSNLLGIDVLITQEHVAKILGLDNQGQDVNSYKKATMYGDSIKADLYPPGTGEKDYGKAKNMKPEFDIAFRVLLAAIIPRKGGKDTVSIPHQHFLWFLHKRVKINLASFIFEHLCLMIKENQHKAVATLHHPRLISEIIRQTKLIEILRQKEKLRVFQTAKLDATLLVNMKKKTDEEIIKIDNPLKSIFERYFWCDGFPTISEHDNEEVIQNFLAMVRRETGAKVNRSMIVGVPDWDVFKGPKDITKSRKKPRLVEQGLLEDSEHSKNDDADSGAEGSGSEDREEADAAQRALQAKKERRSKKRNDQPSGKDQADARPSKKPRTKASKTSKITKTNTCSTAIAQGSKIPPSIPQQQTISPTIDITKPVSMILPGQQTKTHLIDSPTSSLSSSSESTPSEYSTDTAAAIKASTRYVNKKK
jgi:hypothetical protein